ncbi:RNA polymerase recycling motor HelD [Oceanirhabdus sp. W0125-5]|uniref:RNA polymerase recycling motor HelD n=1 Tax=Oceanirhabdus sp. W0125-5 TaxID=2999116 RepID=UPI0022F30293|nr:RNA polymerase recycling motor HelD [Oceanirhabdus sp. W0125-5]WBW95156.1 AAA family ATPase [Oceanirhabdus sp. W0125-5]
MCIEKKSDYLMESSRLDLTLKHLNIYYDKTIKTVAKIDEEVEYGIRHFNSDNAEQFNELVINSVLQSNLKTKVQNLVQSLNKPYFSRVDFKEDSSDEDENLYIGKTSLMNEETHKLLVIDWRAPIANLYYEGRIGEAHYECPEGIINGVISLKRQYSIENSNLKDYFDIDITTNDEFLQASLGANADNRLKDIVSTIQAEQNRVIRADMWKPLIVQGAAGGGKTTIALHRIAYLIYTYEKTFTPDNFMIIAPNRFFLNYISEVLPELGVDKVIQTTYEDFARMVLGKKVKIREGYIKLGNIVNKSMSSNIGNSTVKEISHFKSSLEFKDLLEEYIDYLEESFLPDEDFKIYKFKLISRENLMKLFKEEYKHLPFKKRIDEMKKHLNNVLKRNKQKLLDKVELIYDEKLNQIRHKMKDGPERRKLFIKMTDERDLLLEKIKKQSKTLVNDYLKKIEYRTVEEYYREFLEKLVDSKLEDILVKDTCTSTIDSIIQNLYEIEDLAPLLLLKYSIFGLDEKITVRHVVIDEAQDFSLFQLYMLKTLIGSSSMTILGDLCQGINSYRGIEDWQDVTNKIFTETKSTFLKLDQSYRTTVEIMDKASSVIEKLDDEKLPPAKPVLRHGDDVSVIELDSYQEICRNISMDIDNMESRGYSSLAIICKTLDECMKIKKILKGHNKNLTLIQGNEKKYNGGIAIIPSYLVKGLEFDMVIVANGSKEMYAFNQMDVKLLYVALTRPLHKLNIYSLGEKSNLL